MNIKLSIKNTFIYNKKEIIANSRLVKTDIYHKCFFSFDFGFHKDISFIMLKNKIEDSCTKNGELSRESNPT